MNEKVQGSFVGKVAIVTGAGQGGGRGAAINFAREGATVVLVGRTASKLEAVAAEIKSLGARSLVVTGDVAVQETIAACVSRTLSAFGRLDILVNAAQSPDLRYGPLLQVTPEVMHE